MEAIEQCKLCNQQKELVNSHILPEFLYENLYDEKHRAITISSTPGEKEHFVQKGIREHLLCKDCETKFSQYEGYAADILRSIPADSINSSKQYIELKDVNYAKFKLFQLSILWRGNIAQGPMFSAINLGPRHEHSIHNMLLLEEPGKFFEYGCLMILIQNPDAIKKIIWSPVKERIDGYIYYRFLLYGIFWHFFASSHTNRFPFRNYFLSDNGTLRILIAPWSEKEILNPYAKLIKAKYDGNY